jgi:hypothetical protein
MLRVGLVVGDREGKTQRRREEERRKRLKGDSQPRKKGKYDEIFLTFSLYS